MISKSQSVVAVIIGRNEGGRLIRCLDAVSKFTTKLIYVDSASVDDSVKEASKRGAHVVLLNMTKPFTAARARNAGFEKAYALFSDTEFVQFIDGDCEVLAGWLETSVSFLQKNPQIAVVSGVLNERFPEKSIYNMLCNIEWKMPVGEVKSCGGNALMRVKAFKEADGFMDTLIAGEEPELCVRLRQKGWKIWHLDNDMMLHDANMIHLSQWWKRAVRGGYAFAEGSYLHGAAPEFHWVAESRRAWVWGAILPAIILIIGFLNWKFSLLLFLIYPLQICRLALKEKHLQKWLLAAHLVLSKFPEAIGQIEFYKRRFFGKKITLIEYK